MVLPLHNYAYLQGGSDPLGEAAHDILLLESLIQLQVTREPRGEILAMIHLAYR